MKIEDRRHRLGNLAKRKKGMTRRAPSRTAGKRQPESARTKKRSAQPGVRAETQ
ncbi:hypothetical protein AcV7_006987 [Taiwanofungus camphoratus]|nr:hypothetical protein AcV7_006987 [Antrodia cinnamomea]